MAIKVGGLAPDGLIHTVEEMQSHRVVFDSVYMSGIDDWLQVMVTRPQQLYGEAITQMLSSQD